MGFVNSSNWQFAGSGTAAVGSEKINSKRLIFESSHSIRERNLAHDFLHFSLNDRLLKRVRTQATFPELMVIGNFDGSLIHDFM